MSRNLGSIELGDNESLEEILDSIGYSIDIDTEFNNYFDMDVVWDEAKDYMETNDTEEAEVRIRGLDYIEVYK